MTFRNVPAARQIGRVLARAVVPAWVLTGAVFKLVERTPNNLPSQIVSTARDLGVDLDILLRTLIGLEFMAAAVMIFVARLARPAAIFMLACFCAILVGELWAQSGSCGCFGSIKIHPGVMLAIDGALLLGVVFFRPPAGAGAEREPRWPLVAAALAIAAGFGASFGMPGRTVLTTTVQDGGNGVKPPPRGFWYAKAIDQWPGRSLEELDELFSVIPDRPDGLAAGRKRVVLFRRDCEHCEEMFYNYFGGPLEVPVTAYEIPVKEPEWEVPRAEGVTVLRLPYDEKFWVVQTPLVITLQDGKVVCAREGVGFEECLQ